MRTFKTLALTFLTIFFCGGAYAQMDLFRKKENLKDFNYKTLMVVLENNSLMDATIKSAVEKEWILSKFEFCSPEDFDKLKGDTSYYFLVRVKGIFKKEREPAMEFLSLLKGGPAGVQGVDQMADILSMPLQPLDDGEGYILPFIDSYIKVFQGHVLRIQRRKIAAHLGLLWYSNRISDLKGRTVLINKDDLSAELSGSQVEKMFRGHARVVDEEEIAEALDNQAPRTVVSICIAPEIEQQGSFCYKMLLGADTHELFYYRKQKINSNNPKGFLKEDIKKISIPFSE